MFGLSMWEIAVIALVILFVVGPKRLPDVAKSIGKGYGEFKRTFNEMKQSVNVDDNNLKTTRRNSDAGEDKIKTYSEQYKSQWEEKFSNEETAKPAKLESASLNNTDKKSEENKG